MLLSRARALHQHLLLLLLLLLPDRLLCAQLRQCLCFLLGGQHGEAHAVGEEEPP
jgi:hypothetical protein